MDNMIRIVNRTYTGLACGETLEILADTEEDILALGRDVSDGYDSVKAGPGSIARVVGFGATYELSPSGAWVKG